MSVPLAQSNSAKISSTLNKVATTFQKSYSPSSHVQETLKLNNINPLSKKESAAIGKRVLIHVGSGTAKGVTLRVTPSDDHQVSLRKGKVVIDNDTVVSLKLIQRILNDEELKRVNPKVKEAVKELFEDCTEEFADRRNAIGALKKADRRFQKALARTGINKAMVSRFIGILKDEDTDEEKMHKKERAKFDKFKDEYEHLRSAISDFKENMEKQSNSHD